MSGLGGLGGALHRRRHEGGRNGVDDVARENRVDLPAARLVDVPAVDFRKRVELLGTPCTPERDRRTLVEDPPHRERQHLLADAVLLDIAQGLVRNEIFAVALSRELGVDLAQVVAGK